ncbi:ABC-type branched-chain amino acid transport systems, ATPase component [Aminobacter sp. J15]|nr:ABC-type branched-chain amino acid transport systems, ATPase component [Aminobacter sp. J15]
MGHFSMEKPPNPGSVLGGNQQRMIAEGVPRDVASNQTVIEAYLGPGMAARLKSQQTEAAS